MKKYRSHTSRNDQLYVYQPAHPNAADPQYFTDRILDALTTLVSAMGFVSALVFLVAIA